MKTANLPKKTIRPGMILAAILAVAVIVRVVFLIQLGRSELGDFLTLDSKLYYSVARMVTTGGTLPPGALTFNPFYAGFLIVMFQLFGDGLLLPRIVQLIFGLLTVVLVYLAGSRLGGGSGNGTPAGKPKGKSKGEPAEIPGGEITAVVAAAMAVLYSTFLLYEGMIVGSVFEVFFLAAALLLALAYDQVLTGTGRRQLRLGSKRISPWVLCLILGALCGAGALARPNLFFLLIAALPVWLLVRNRWKRRGIIEVACFAAGVALFLAPPIAWNARNTGRFVPVTAHGGFNFYVGNGPGATGVFSPPPDVRANVFQLPEDVKARAERATGRTMTQEEVSRYYLSETLRYIGGDPARWLGLLGRKLVLFFGPGFRDMPNAFFYRQSCGVLGLLFLPYVVIAALGICGFIVLWRSGRNRAVVSIFLACGIASVLLFFVNLRYRLPTVPVLIVLGAFFIEWGRGQVGRKRLGPLALMLALGAAFLLFVTSRPPVQISNGAAYAALGIYHAERNEEAKAAEAFAEAHRLDPERIAAASNYARILSQQGQYEEAAEIYARAYARVPRYPRLAVEYGMVLLRLDRREEAKRLFVEGTTSDLPRDRALACRLLAETAMAEGQSDQAIEWVKRALEIFPGEPELTEMLRRFEAAPR
jgi:Tfp pilus assembly protein PilF